MSHDPKKLRTILIEAAAPHLELTFRPMFGGIMGYGGGKLFASLSDVGLALKLAGADRDEMLSLPGAQPLRYAPDQPQRKSYVLVPEAMLSTPDQFGSWVNRSTATLPIKSKKIAK